MVFAGENLVYENGSKLAATKLLTCDMAVADVDLDRLVAERRRSTTWTRADDAPEATTVEFSFEGVLAKEPVLRDACDIDRVFPRAPFVPADHGDLAERCETILDLQTAGLKTRLAHTGTKAAVIGLSGGLDSTLALLVTVRASMHWGCRAPVSRRSPCQVLARRIAPSPMPSRLPATWA